LEYFTDIWDIFVAFAAFCVYLVHFSGFGATLQEKSGNPGREPIKTLRKKQKAIDNAIEEGANYD
jgi:hypothetical protein